MALIKGPMDKFLANMTSEKTIKPSSKDNLSTNQLEANKRLSVERIYQKKTQLEHILLRPDTYIGSVEPVTQQMWVFDEGQGMVFRDVTYVPGLYKIFDEILVNAADNKQRDSSMNCIRIEIDDENNKISIYNNGKGIPVVEHKDEKMFVPSLIFGHLLTSSNYNDDEKKVTGGRNGYGAKLCNIFSHEFIVETSSKADKKQFKQVWKNNMGEAGSARVTTSSGEDFTRVTFKPDLSKFKMDRLDDDIIALFSRRAYDIAGSTKGVKVFLNGSRLAVNSFKDYVQLYLKGKTDETGNELKVAFEDVNERWQIAVALSDQGFRHMSFVNSIATTKGGRHVDHIADQIINKVAEAVKKKNKGGVTVKPFQLKNHIWVFVNCLIENPTFDSQTKENMTLQVKSFGSKCTPSEKFFNDCMKLGIVESILSWVKFKAQSELNKKCSGRKTTKVDGLPKLEDANDAGGKFSSDCTLILTEGDSAKALVVAGFGVIGRDKYGVFPLRGKLLNVREATHKQIMENAEINSIIKIMGLQYKKKYESMDDLKTLRYGRLMIMTDQDHDGSHIKGLLINFIHHNWPSLLKLPFLEEFITPIVRCTKDRNVLSFYSIPEFEEWKQNTQNWQSYKIKYYKGLGTSTNDEAKEYFSDITRHRIKFKYTGPQDDESVELAFSKKMVDARKDWLTASLEEKKRRKELGLPEEYLYEKDTKVVTYKDFVNKELVLFSNLDNERSIPSMVDGLKPGQRKVLFACFKRKLNKEVKVAQFAGVAAAISAYHHGEASLLGTIINLAQNFVGSNNINLLVPQGQFGTRLQGGKDHASARYIHTYLSPIARKIFSPLDDPLYDYLYDDNLRVEPIYYIPILPMVLVNGAEGIGTGWSTKIPNFNPKDIVENLKRLIRGEDVIPLKPWYKGYVGTIEKVGDQKYISCGEAALLGDNSFEITELPVRVWTQSYKESVLVPMLEGTEKTQSVLLDYKEYNTESTVRFVIYMNHSKFEEAKSQGIHKYFKLQSPINLSQMVLFDSSGVIKRYDSPEEILKEFFEVRMKFYHKRKAYLEGMLEAESLKLKNQARFILEKNDGKIKMENVKKKDILNILIERKYDSDPVKEWQKINRYEERNDFDEVDSDREQEEQPQEGKNYDYLLDMAMRSMLKEKVEELLRKRDEKLKELEELKSTSASTLWLKDLDEFLKELANLEEKEQKSLEKTLNSGSNKLMPKGKSKGKGLDHNIKPSAFGERVIPVIDYEGFKKKEPKIVRKTKEPSKNKKEVIDLGTSDEEKEVKKTKSTKRQKCTSKPKSVKRKKKEFDDSTDEEEEFSFSESEENIETYVPKPIKEKIVKEQNVENEQFPPEDILLTFDKESLAHNEDNIVTEKVEKVVKKSKPKETKTKKSSKVSKIKYSSDSDNSEVIQKKKTKKKAKTKYSDFESDVELEFEASPVVPREKPTRSRKIIHYNFDTSEEDEE